MPNIGHTVVEATGPAESLEALLTHVRPTAQGRLDFTLSPLAHPDPAPDGHLSWASLDANDERVVLSIGLRHDMDCLFLAEQLAQRFPTLRVIGYFKAECDDGAFQALCFENGDLAYQAAFDDDAYCCMPYEPYGQALPDGPVLQTHPQPQPRSPGPLQPHRSDRTRGAGRRCRRVMAGHR